MRRKFNEDEPELMDRMHTASEDLGTALVNIQRLNEQFGCYRLIRRFLKCWVLPGRPYRLLDLATGYGDIPRMIVDWCREREIAVKIDAVDFHPETLKLARAASEGYPEIEYQRSDIREHHSSMTYDVVLCTLALHHFSEEDAVKVLARALALSHHRVLVSDLERSHLAKAGVRLATTFLFREAITRYDARLSIERAFSFREFGLLFDQAGWEGFCHRRFFPARQAVWTDAERGANELRVGEVAPDFA